MLPSILCLDIGNDTPVERIGWDRNDFFCPMRCALSCCHEILEWPWVYFSLTLLPTGVVLWSKTRASKRMDKSPNSGRSPLEHYRRLDPSIFLDLLDDCSSSMARWRFRTKTDIICDDCGPHVVEFSILRDLRFSLILRLRFDSAEKWVKLALSFESPVQWLKRRQKKQQQKRTFMESHWSDWNLMDFLTNSPRFCSRRYQKPPGDSVWPRPRIFQSTQPVFCAMNLQSNLGRPRLVWLASLITSVTSVK